MATRMQQRRGTASQWTSLNLVLFDGELGIEQDTAKIKVGNGVTPWNDLPYIQNDTGEPSISRSSAVAGQIPVLQNDGTLKFSGGRHSTAVSLFGPEPRNTHALGIPNTGGSFIWPGDALSSSTWKLRADLLPYKKVAHARLFVVWTPWMAANAIRVMKFDNGPANLVEIGRLYGVDVNTPYTGEIILTNEINAIISGGIEKQIGFQVLAGINGPYFFLVRLELVWEA